jgi:Tol biopolymer transport system component
MGLGIYLLWTGPGRSASPALPGSTPTPSPNIELVSEVYADGRFFFLQSDDDAAELFMYDPQSATTVDVSQSKSYNLQAVIAPNAESAAFLSDREEVNVFQLYVVLKPGEPARQLTSPATLNGYQLPAGALIAWSPSSLYLAFTAERDGRQQLFTTDITGSVLQKVTSDRNAQISSIAWIDDANLVFASDRDAGQLKFWVVERDGRNLRELIK